MRVDQLLFEKGLAKSRTQSQKLIREGKVKIRVAESWQLVKKASIDVDEQSEFAVEASEEQQFVSRAGLKLRGALERLNFSVAKKRALDVGQSTGGFSDCLIQSGAALVVGVDVGHSQLSPSLRNHPQVVSLEGVNARSLSTTHFADILDPPLFDLVVMDVSFISQTLIIPRIGQFLHEGAAFISLVKPQFEVGPDGLGKGGIVRDQSLFPKVKEKLHQTLRAEGFRMEDYFESAILGGDGNREFFFFASRSSVEV